MIYIGMLVLVILVYLPLSTEIYVYVRYSHIKICLKYLLFVYKFEDLLY